MLSRFTIELFSRCFIVTVVLYQVSQVITEPNWAIKYVLPLIMFLWILLPAYDYFKKIITDKNKKDNTHDKDVRRKKK